MRELPAQGSLPWTLITHPRVPYGLIFSPSLGSELNRYFWPGHTPHQPNQTAAQLGSQPSWFRLRSRVREVQSQGASHWGPPTFGAEKQLFLGDPRAATYLCQSQSIRKSCLLCLKLFFRTLGFTPNQTSSPLHHPHENLIFGLSVALSNSFFT